MLDNQKGLSKRQFPEEHPTARMLEVWNRAVSSIATETINGKMCLPNPLDRFLRTPLRNVHWYTSEDRQELYQDSGQGLYTVYTKQQSGSRRQTRSATRNYTKTGVTNYRTPDWSYASVDEDAGGMVALHSTTSPPSPKVMKAKNFLETLKTYPNQSLWENMTVEGNGEWIHTALQLSLIHI